MRKNPISDLGGWSGRGTRGRTKVLVFSPLYPPAFRGGGPIRSIAALVSSAPEIVDAAVFTSDRDLGVGEALPVVANNWIGSERGSTYYATIRSPRLLWRGLLAARRLKPDIVHLNSFMNPVFSILPVILWRVGFWGRAALLISPRGEFGEGAMSRRSGKKRAYIAFFRVLRIAHSVIWHSTAPHETEGLRQFWGRKVVIIERANDTVLPGTAIEPPGGVGTLRLVFLGRIVEHKGLAIVLAALRNVSAPIELDVYGSREDEKYVAYCEALAADVPPQIQVRFRGPIEPTDVLASLSAHDVLVMPTAGENFGHVIAEALAASCAVVVTPHTPWSDVVSAGGGLIIDRTPEAWSQALYRLANESPEERLARRKAAGRAFEDWRSRPQCPHLWEQMIEVWK